MTLGELMTNGRYLPKALRDFHDQKGVFKAVHEAIDVEGHPYAKDVDWVAGHCYTIDIFLWFMAKHGYTLQKSRIRGADFSDLDATVKAAQDRRVSRMRDLLKEPAA